MSRIHFIGTISPFEEAINPSVSIAGNRCQKGILEGLKADNEIVQVISYRTNRIFPFGNKIYIPSLHTQYNGLNCHFIPILNLPVIKEILINISTIFYLLKEIKSGDFVLFYNVWKPFPISVFILRKLLGVKLFVLACDVHVPGQTVSNTLRWRYHYLKQKFVLPRVDGVIAVTGTILDDFNCKRKSLIMEGGISQDLFRVDYVRSNTNELFKLLYVGALDRLNGVDLLLEAFSKNTNPNLRLIIAGQGELRNLVEEAAIADSRIEFFGIIPHAKVIELYKEISLLICLRITKKIHTGYFFPSKLIEYLSTGIPILCTNLKTWNFNLNDFCYVIKDETVDAIDMSINDCIAQHNFLITKAKLGKSYVREEMLWNIQGKKISTFLTK